MGLDPITQGVIGAGMSLIGGKKSKVSQTDPSKQIAPETDYEASMRLGLTNQANKLLSSGMSIQDAISKFMPGIMKQSLSTQQGLINGQLPAAFQTNFENGIRSGVDNTVGNIANNIARRGIGLNGTSFTNQLNSVNQAVADASAKNFSNNISLLSGVAAQPVNTASSLSSLGMNMLQVPYNLYSNWRNSRYSNKAEPIVQEGSAPPLAGLGSQLLQGAFGL